MRIPLHCFQTDILTGQTPFHYFFSKFLSQRLFLIFRPLSSGGTFWTFSSCSLLFLGPSLFGFFLRTMGNFICLEWSVIVWLFFLVVVVVIVIVIFIRLILLPFLSGSLWCAAAWSRLRGTRKIWISRSFYFFTCILESWKFGEIMTRNRDFALQLFEEQTSQTPYATIPTLVQLLIQFEENSVFSNTGRCYFNNEFKKLNFDTFLFVSSIRSEISILKHRALLIQQRIQKTELRHFFNC